MNTFPAAGLLKHLRSALSRLRSDRRGVAAVEFAFIAPVLLSLYFVTMEVSQAIEVNKKVGRVGSMVADLLTQQQATTKSEVEAVLKIGESILQPYNRSKSKITVTAIQITDENTPKVQVAWSRKLENGAVTAGAAKNSITTVPDTLKIRNTFLIRVESQLAYKPVITWSAEGKQVLGLAAAFDGIGMKETYYLRPRMSSTVPCADC
ncbi:MAG: pilus assembly protein [Rhizobiaceae bacterium]|nr:pilus assembly protein [Rhizobiaceae bacterium]